MLKDFIKKSVDNLEKIKANEKKKGEQAPLQYNGQLEIEIMKQGKTIKKFIHN